MNERVIFFVCWQLQRRFSLVPTSQQYTGGGGGNGGQYNRPMLFQFVKTCETMDSNDEKMFLENIEEYVMDEGKVVTYKWLSKTLGLHINTAKQLLYKYAMPNGTRISNVHVNFLIGGVLLDGSGKIQIVREDDVDKVKEKFKMVTSEHVYSVQKCSKIPDLNILFGIDNLKMENDDRLGAITCKKAVRRLENDIAALRLRALASTAVPNNKLALNTKKISPLNDVVPKKSNGKEMMEEKAADSKASEAEPVKPKTIASMFTAQSKKPASNKSPVTNNVVKKGKGGIASFFPKQAEKPTVDTKSIIVKMDKEIENVSEMEVDEDDSKKSENDQKKAEAVLKEKSKIRPTGTDKTKTVTGKSEVDDNKNASKPPLSKIADKSKTFAKVEDKDKTSKGKRKNKKKVSEDAEKPAKKRKRIMVVSDSSSEDEIFGKDDDDDDVEMNPGSPDIPPEDSKSQSSDEDIIPPTPIPQAGGSAKSRNRIRKLVDKTFQDEDGFVTTKKEYVYESCSDDDNEVHPIEEKKLVAIKNRSEKDCEMAVELQSKSDVEEEKEVNSKTGKKGLTKTKKQPTKKTPPASTGPKSKQQSIMSFFSKN